MKCIFYFVNIYHVYSYFFAYFFPFPVALFFFPYFLHFVSCAGVPAPSCYLNWHLLKDDCPLLQEEGGLAVNVRHAGDDDVICHIGSSQYIVTLLCFIPSVIAHLLQISMYL